jgi:hypothetical protein
MLILHTDEEVAELTGSASIPSSSLSPSTTTALQHTSSTTTLLPYTSNTSRSNTANMQSTLAIVPSITAATQTGTSSAGNVQSSSTAINQSFPAASSSTAGLSTGAIVGIAIGGVAAVAHLGVVGCLCFRYGRRWGLKEGAGGTSRTVDTAHNELGSPTAYYPSPKSAETEKSKAVSSAFQATSRPELDYGEVRAELGEACRPGA